MAQLTEDDTQRLKTAYPGCVLLRAVAENSADGERGDEYVFKPGVKGDYLRFKGMQRQSMLGASGAGQEAALYARGLCVFPSPEAFDELRERTPAVAEEMGQALLEKQRGGLEVREGKL